MHRRVTNAAPRAVCVPPSETHGDRLRDSPRSRARGSVAHTMRLQTRATDPRAGTSMSIPRQARTDAGNWRQTRNCVQRPPAVRLCGAHSEHLPGEDIKRISAEGIPLTPSSRVGFPCGTNVSRNAGPGSLQTALPSAFFLRPPGPTRGRNPPTQELSEFCAWAGQGPSGCGRWCLQDSAHNLSAGHPAWPACYCRRPLAESERQAPSRRPQEHSVDQTLDRQARELHGVSGRDKIKTGPTPRPPRPFLGDLITDVLTFLLPRVSLKDLPRRNIWKLCFRYNPVWESLLLALSSDDRGLNYSEPCTLRLGGWVLQPHNISHAGNGLLAKPVSLISH